MSDKGSSLNPVDRLDHIRARFSLIQRLRDVLCKKGYLQVDTNCLIPEASPDPFITPFSAEAKVRGMKNPRTFYLRTSPEFELKCLLARGFEAIFEIARVFRQGDLGNLHNPEFCMAEWYRTGWSHLELMDELVEILNEVLEPGSRSGFLLPNEIPMISVDDLFVECTSIAVCEYQEDEQLWEQARSKDLVEKDSPREFTEVFSWLWAEHLEKHLCQMEAIFVVDWPGKLAELAQIKKSDPRIANKFELMVRGVELANGYSELTSPDEYRKRFEANLEHRKKAGLPILPLPEHFIYGIKEGLPPSAGVSLGVDRLAMLASGSETVHNQLNWSWRNLDPK
ncbi:MAG: elongation factor P--(R)-beta-lysine ligase [Pseudomonadota bacterium]